uniref:Uncharacterized protein n=1 Tax=Avena sativa TaxID=4498 RepID=A0ACD5WDM9_AVESA
MLTHRYYCYMLIQILQSIGQLLTSGARPVAGRLGPSVTSLKLAHTVPNGDACGGCGGRQPPAVRARDRGKGCRTCTPSLLFLLTSLCQNDTVSTSSSSRPLKFQFLSASGFRRQRQIWMNPPPATSPAPERREFAARDASEERGPPASGTAIVSATPEEAPVTDSTETTESDAQRGLHNTAVVNSEGTRKRNFQPGTKEAHVSSFSSSHTREISVVETKDARSKFQKKSGNEEAFREEGKDTAFIGISEELKENENKSSLNCICLKDEKEQKNGSRGKENNYSICNSSTSQDLPSPNSTGNSCLTTIVTENNKEAPKCLGLGVKQNPNEVTPTNSVVVVNAKTTEGETLDVNSIIQKKYDEVLSSSFEEKVTENVATFLGSCMLESNQSASSNVSQMPLQGGVNANVKNGYLDSTTGEYFYQREDFIKPSDAVSSANVKTNCLDSTTGEYFYRREDFIKPSDVVSRHYSSEERRNLGSVKHMREAIPHTSLNTPVKENALPSENQKNQSYPFNEGANFFQIGTSYFNLRADVHHSMDIHGGTMSDYRFERGYLDRTSTGRNEMQERELAFLSTYHNNNRISPLYPCNEGSNFFQVGMADPNFRAGVHHSMDIYGSGMANPNFRAGVHHSMDIYGSGAMPDPNFRAGVHHSMDIYGPGMANPNFRAGVHHSMDIYGSGAMPDPNIRAGVHHSMDIYGSGMANPNFRAGVHHSMDMYGSGTIPDPNFRASVHHSKDIYGSGAMAEYGFIRSYFDHTSTERNKMQEKELAYSSTHHNINRISPSSLPQAYSENLRVPFSPRHSLVGVRKKKLLILDLNGLLADINEDIHNAHMADAKVRGKLVFRRPYCDDFLNFCIRNFELGIWSSRKRKNVDSVVDILMRDLKPYLLFSWDRSKCTITGRKTLENMHKPIVLKELRKLWNKEEPGLPWVEGEFSPSNTLLVDDSPYKALRNPPYSAIFPHPFSYLNSKDNSLGPGGDLRVYLENLVFADDVECFVRNHPFGQPFITPSDPHWNFYAEIAAEGYGSVTCRA